MTGSIQKAQTFMAGVSFFNRGEALMDTMAAGIRARVQVVIAEITEVAQIMRDHLQSFPAKAGLLSDIHRLKFGETMAGSIHAEPMIKAMRAAALATMGAAAVNAPAMVGPSIAAAQVDADAVRLQAASTASRPQAASAGTPRPDCSRSRSKSLKSMRPIAPIDVQRQVEMALENAGRKLYALRKEQDRLQRRTSV